MPFGCCVSVDGTDDVVASIVKQIPSVLPMVTLSSQETAQRVVKPGQGADIDLDIDDDSTNDGGEVMARVSDVRPPDAAVARSFCANIEFSKTKPFGIALDLCDGAFIRVGRIDKLGPVAEYNESASPREQIGSGDFIMAINAAAGNGKSMIKALQQGGMVNMQVRRPERFTLEGISKGDGAWGLDLTYHSRSSSIVVKQVFRSGAIAAWNETAPDEYNVKPGDYILEVNGLAGNPQDLHALIRNSEVVDLVISRPARD